MWILQCDGDLLNGKKMWLKPGQQYLFGRNKVQTTANEYSLGLNHKTVSRKHLVVTVAPIAPGDGLELYHKSALTLMDDSKIGTELDGHRFVKSSKSLSGNRHEFYLGQATHQTFKITWWPVVMTLQGSAARFASLQSRLEQLDIKMIDAYVTSETTHVVAASRNVPKGLRALVNARYLVSQDFIDAIELAATASAETGTSPLEEDFEAKWPDAMDYVPPPGSEPHPRPAELFKPDEARKSLFDGFTFIFADARQHENMSPFVMDGGAKAIKYDMQNGETTVGEFVQFVLSVADKKGLRSLGDSDQGKGVVFVRFRGLGDLQDWSIRFIESVDAALEQRSIEQNEFLDAIVTKDVSKLRQGLQEEDSQHVAGTRAPPSTAAQATRPAPVGMSNLASLLDEQPSQSAAQESVAASQPQRSAASKLRSRRVITQSRFKGFDDFDESQFSTQRRKSQVQGIEDSDDAESQNNGPSQSQSQALSHANGNAMDDDQSLFVSQSQDAPAASQASRLSNIRKRPAPQSADENEDDAEDALFPAAAAMKRRKLEDAAAGKKSLVPDKPAVVESARKGKKAPVKELDVASAARIRAKAIDAQRGQSETQRPDEEMTAEEIAEFRYLGIAEQMKMRIPGANPRARNGAAENERWDDRWNGRKNFKKFVKRRPGTADDDDAIAVNNRARKVIVTLEEAKRKTFGVGEEDYFLNPAPGQRGRTKTGASQSQAQSQSQPFRRQGTGYVPHTGAADEDDQEDLEPEEIAGQPREGVVADALRRISGQSTTQTQSQASSRTTASGKRGAAAIAASAPPAKMRATQARGRAAAAAGDDDDDDSDGEVKFRLRRPVRK